MRSVRRHGAYHGRPSHSWPSPGSIACPNHGIMFSSGSPSSTTVAKSFHSARSFPHGTRCRRRRTKLPARLGTPPSSTNSAWPLAAALSSRSIAAEIVTPCEGEILRCL